jgi:hypothetical protein
MLSGMKAQGLEGGRFGCGHVVLEKALRFSGSTLP